MVTAIAWMYVRFGKLPAIAGALYGVKPVVIAVILQALWGLGWAAVKNTYLGIVGAFSVVLVFFGFHPLLLLFVAGLTACLPALKSRRLTLPSFPPLAASAAGVAGATASFSLGSLFLVFLKVGAIVFGSGYVLLAFLRTDLVLHRGWLTDAQLVDAVAVGQVTPGPVFTTATFIGYLLGGLRGAEVATVGIFLPAFLLVAASGPLVPRIRKSKFAGAFLDGVNVGSLALMAEVTLQLARTSLSDVVTVVLAVVSLIVLLRFRWNSAWLVLIGALVGLGAKALHGF
jgi:chromate transporter